MSMPNDMSILGLHAAPRVIIGRPMGHGAWWERGETDCREETFLHAYPTVNYIPNPPTVKVSPCDCGTTTAASASAYDVIIDVSPSRQRVLSINYACSDSHFESIL